MLSDDVDIIVERPDSSAEKAIREAVVNNLRNATCFPFLLTVDPEDSEGGGYRCGARFSTLDVRYGISSGSFVSGTVFLLDSNGIQEPVVVRNDKLVIENRNPRNEDPDKYRKFEEAVERVNRFCEGSQVRRANRSQGRYCRSNRHTSLSFSELR